MILGLIIGMLVVMLAGGASDRLGDNHPYLVVRNLRWYERLYRLRPDPLDVAYGLPIGLLVVLPHGPLWMALLLACGLALSYEYWLDHTAPAGLEVEDVRDVVAGALLGWLLGALL